MNSKGLHQSSEKEKERRCVVFTSSTKPQPCGDGKEMHKKVQCTCKDVELPIAFFKSLSFFSPLLVWRQYRYQQWPFSHHRRIIHVQNLSKLTGKQMDKVRRIVYPKLRPFHFQIKTYYLSDANRPFALRGHVTQFS